MGRASYWLVGLDPRNVEKQQARFDRWEVIYVSEMHHAIREYIRIQDIKVEEFDDVKVWHKSETPFSVLVWISKYRVFLPILRRSILTTKPIGELEVRAQ